MNGVLLDLGFVASHLYKRVSVILLLYVDNILVIDICQAPRKEIA